MPSKFLESLGIASGYDAIELEQELGISFKDFTPQHCDVWRKQTVFLHHYAVTHAVSKAARMAGASVYTAQRWQNDNILGFNRRMEVALLEYTDEIEVILLGRARESDSPPTLLAMLLRAQMPEKYGPARRSSAPSDNNRGDHDSKPTLSDDNQALLAEILQEFHELKRLAGQDDRDSTSQPNGNNLSPTDPLSVGAGFRPASDPAPITEHNSPNLSPAGDEHNNPNLSPAGDEHNSPNLSPAGGEIQRGGSSPASSHSSVVSPPPTSQHPTPRTQNLTRRQRRELQRKERKRQKSHRARAPT